MTTVAIAYHSGFGHTEVLAKKIAQGVESAGAKAALYNVAELNDALWDGLQAADGIIFGSPTYMGTVSAPFKAFMDASSKVFFGQGWKDKMAAGFTNSASPSGDKSGTLNAMAVLASQHSMVWVSQGIFPTPDGMNRLGGWMGLIAQSENAPAGDTNPPAADQAYAVAFGARVGAAVLRWAK